nr:NADH dehydrogenase [ubiquinone] 1 beta subcomplex subunit 4 [Meriones unguiculatus]
MSGSKYKPAPLATLPSTLDPAEYDVSLETRRLQVERLSLRARLKREYLLQLNDPNRQTLIVSGAGRDCGPGHLAWVHAGPPGSNPCAGHGPLATQPLAFDLGCWPGGQGDGLGLQTQLALRPGVTVPPTPTPDLEKAVKLCLVSAFPSVTIMWSFVIF